MSSNRSSGRETAYRGQQNNLLAEDRFVARAGLGDFTHIIQPARGFTAHEADATDRHTPLRLLRDGLVGKPR